MNRIEMGIIRYLSLLIDIQNYWIFLSYFQILSVTTQPLGEKRNSDRIDRI